jgi:hypothetical protein
MSSTALVYDPSKGLSPFDRIMLKGAAAGKSPSEISELTNSVISPAACAARILEILEARDWLSQAQQRMLLTDELMELKDHLKERALEFRDKDSIKPLISMFTLIDKRLADNKFDLQAAMEQISRAHAQLMLSAIGLALERSFLELEKLYPDVQKSVLLAVFHEAMPDVVREIESHVPA